MRSGGAQSPEVEGGSRGPRAAAPAASERLPPPPWSLVVERGHGGHHPAATTAGRGEARGDLERALS